MCFEIPPERKAQTRYLQPSDNRISDTANNKRQKLKRKIKILLVGLLLLLTAGLIAFTTTRNSIDDQILAYTVDTQTQDLQLFWKNDKGEIFKSIQNLKNYVESKNLNLTFAINV